MWIIIGLLAISTFLLWWLSDPFYWRKHNIPYLVPAPLFGNMFSLFTQGMLKFTTSLHYNFPNEPFYGFHIFTRPALLVKDPRLIQHILVTDFEHFTSHGLNINQDRDIAGRSIFSVHGQQWKELRGKLSPYFTPGKVKAMLSCVDSTMVKAIEVIDKNIANDKSTDIFHLAMNISTDIITQAMFGIETGTFEKNSSVFSEICGEMFGTKLTSKFFLNTISPKLFEFFKFTLLETKHTDKIVEIVRETIDYRKKQNIQRQDYLQGMMELVENNNPPEKKYFPDNTRVPDYEIDTLISQGIYLLTAGSETTAITISFLIYELAVHPEIQDKCRQEIQSITKDTGNEITIDDLSKLVYLGAALQETLRKHSPFNVINRECTKDYKIPGTDVTIHKGTSIILSPLGLHMDAKYYKEPEIFRPERFLDESIITNNGSYFPFSIGPRSCLGKHLANGGMKLVAARILQRYKISICSKTLVPARYSKYNFLKRPADRIWLDFCPINK